jgi:hypothetical protein
MADPTFRPGFHHSDWIDNVDEVVATGPNGFNSRFGAIAGDLRQLSTVVSEIDVAIDLLGDPESDTGTLGLEPTILVPIDLQSTPSAGPPAVSGWNYDVNGIAKPTVNAGGARACMGVALPNGIRLTSLRIVGGFDTGARLVVQLGRAQLNLVIQAPDILATIDSAQQGFANPYDVEVLTDKQLSTVDLTRFRYFLNVNATSLPTNVTPQTSLAAVQLGFAGASTD